MKLLKFEADWCSSCKAQDSILENVNIPVEHCDVDETPEKADEYKIKSLPTMILLKDDKEVKRFIGVTNLETLNKAIDEHR